VRRIPPMMVFAPAYLIPLPTSCLQVANSWGARAKLRENLFAPSFFFFLQPGLRGQSREMVFLCFYLALWRQIGISGRVRGLAANHRHFTALGQRRAGNPGTWGGPNLPRSRAERSLLRLTPEDLK